MGKKYAIISIEGARNLGREIRSNISESFSLQVGEGEGRCFFTYSQGLVSELNFIVE